MQIKLAALCASVALLTSSVFAADMEIKFPADYRTTYTNYLSLNRTQNPDQIIRLFANDIAMQGAGADGKLPYGSILVGEVYKAKKAEDGSVITSSLGERIPAKFALVAVMQRDKNLGNDLPPELKNGNWDYATFKPDGSPAAKDLNECRACHAPLVQSNYVFSYDHLK